MTVMSKEDKKKLAIGIFKIVFVLGFYVVIAYCAFLSGISFQRNLEMSHVSDLEITSAKFTSEGYEMRMTYSYDAMRHDILSQMAETREDMKGGIDEYPKRYSSRLEKDYERYNSLIDFWESRYEFLSLFGLENKNILEYDNK